MQQYGSGADDSVQDFPARFNMKHDHLYSATENEFIRLYRTSDIEHAISVQFNSQMMIMGIHMHMLMVEKEVLT